MSDTNRRHRKFSDADVVRLNSLGHSLGTIADRYNVHPTTVRLRLDNLGIDPADTRRTFMEGILGDLTESQTDWLAKQLGPHLPIKDFVRNLLVEKFISQEQ